MPGNNILEKIKKMDYRKAVYPAISLSFFTAVLFIFIFSIQFLSSNINKVFSVIEDSSIQSQIIQVDLPGYYIVAKRLGISVPQEKNIEANVPVAQVEPLAAQTPQTTTSTTQIKSSLKIEILNSTKTTGLATELKNLLETNGFTIAKTGNQPKLEEITFVKIKKSLANSSLIDEIKNIVAKKYVLGENQTLNDSSEFDAIIVIGAK